MNRPLLQSRAFLRAARAVQGCHSSLACQSSRQTARRVAHIYTGDAAGAEHNRSDATFEAWWFCMRCGLEASDEENFTQRRKGPPHKYYENKFDPDGSNTLCKVCGIRYERFEKAGKLEQFGKLLDPWTHAQLPEKERRSYAPYYQV